MKAVQRGKIQYVGVTKEVYLGYIVETVRIIRPLLQLEDKSFILRIHFESTLIDLEKFSNCIYEDIMIFHVYIKAEVFYFTENSSTSIKSFKEEIIDSYWVEINPKVPDMEILQGTTAIVEGVVKENEDNIYLSMELALILGGNYI